MCDEELDDLDGLVDPPRRWSLHFAMEQAFAAGKRDSYTGLASDECSCDGCRL